MKVVLLAAGFATRLYPLTRERAKPLLEVGGRPIAARILDLALALPGVDEAVVVTNARFREQFEDFLAGYDAPVPIRLVANAAREESERLGAVRDLALALDAFEDDASDVLVAAGDNLCEVDLAPHVALLRATRRPVLAMRTVPGGPPPARYGEIELGEGGRVLAFREKPRAPRSEHVSTGLFLFPPGLRAWLADYLDAGGEPDAPGHFVEWLSTRTELRALPFEGRWFDVGSLETLAEARAAFGDDARR